MNRKEGISGFFYLKRVMSIFPSSERLSKWCWKPLKNVMAEQPYWKSSQGSLFFLDDPFTVDTKAQG